MPVLDIILREPAWPDLADRDDVIHLTNTIGVTCLAGGMESGKASVAFRFDLPDGRPVVAETSLGLLVMAARAFQSKYGTVGDPGPEPIDINALAAALLDPLVGEMLAGMLVGQGLRLTIEKLDA